MVLAALLQQRTMLRLARKLTENIILTVFNIQYSRHDWTTSYIYTHAQAHKHICKIFVLRIRYVVNETALGVLLRHYFPNLINFTFISTITPYQQHCYYFIRACGSEITGRLHTTEAQTLCSQCGIRGEHSGIRADFSLDIRVYPCQFSFHRCPILITQQEQCNRTYLTQQDQTTHYHLTPKTINKLVNVWIEYKFWRIAFLYVMVIQYVLFFSVFVSNICRTVKYLASYTLDVR